MRSGFERERNRCSQLALQLSLLVMLLSQMATATGATLEVNTLAIVNPFNIVDVVDERSLNNATRADSLSASTGGVIGSSGFAGAQGLATANFGLLGVQAGAASFQPLVPDNIFAQGGARALWADEVTLIPVNPALLSTPGSFTYSVSVGGNLALGLSGIPFNLQGSADFNANFYAGFGVADPNSEAFGTVLLTRGSTTPVVSGDSPNVLLTGTAAFTWGVPFPMAAELFANANTFGDAGSTGSIEASAQLLGTLRWLGIESVLDFESNSINDYSVLSVSGTDWRVAAVPEPVNALLFVSALFVLGLRRLLVRRR